jgi:uncharacterized protein (TIGR02646 family)
LRKLDRLPEPECLAANAAQWTKDYTASRQQNPKHPFKWRSQNCYQETRKHLLAMTQGRCAFCDGGLGAESRETVEHFRPKSQFPEFAYAWSNLFPCCDMCQSQKKEQFSEDLLKPDEDDFVFSHFFIVNYKSGELEVSPQADLKARSRAEITLQLYGLNLAARTKARKREWESFCREIEPFLDDYNYRYFLEPC